MDDHHAPGDFTGLPMFARLQPADLERLRAVSWTRRYPKGQILRSENDPAEHLLILEDGRLKAGCPTTTGREVILAIHTPPVAFDKAALLTAGRHLATLTALTPVTIRYLPGATFKHLAEREPSVRQRVLATLASTLSTRTRQLIDIATLDVPGRLARWLLDRATTDRTGDHALTVRLPASQSDLAAELGTTRATINRVLHGFRAAGLIAIHPGRIVLLRPRALAARHDPTVGGSPPARPGMR